MSSRLIDAVELIESPGRQGDLAAEVGRSFNPSFLRIGGNGAVWPGAAAVDPGPVPSRTTAGSQMKPPPIWRCTGWRTGRVAYLIFKPAWPGRRSESGTPRSRFSWSPQILLNVAVL